MSSEVNTYNPAKDPRLTRFFTKLLGEVVALKADRVAFHFNSDEIGKGTIEANGKILRVVNIKNDWYQALYDWLLARNADSVTNKINTSGHLIGNEILTFEHSTECALDKSTKLVLSNFKNYSVDSVFEVLGVVNAEQETWKKAFSYENAIVLLSTPDKESLIKAQGLFLILSGWSRYAFIGEDKDFIEQSDPLLILSIGMDITDAIAQARINGLVSRKNDLALVIQLGFVKKVCSGCAKKTALLPDLFKSLPTYLSTLNTDSYVVGRGCKQCGETGYFGTFALQSKLFVSDTDQEFIFGEKTELELVGHLLKNGAAPLLEIGIKKAFAGLTTIESVLSVARFMPQVYMSYEKKHGKPAENDPLSKPLFEKKKNGIRENPVIMLVEDDPDQREILELALKKQNYTVSSAANGQEGLDLLKKTEIPDLIISDLMMPVMDGSMFVKNVKSDSKFNSVPIMMFTVVADEEKEYELLNLGADDYCEKTVSQKILMKRIENILKRNAHSNA